MLPEVGQLARVRSRQFLVESVVPPPDGSEQTLVRLSCLDDDAQGEPLEVLWEREVDAEIVSRGSWARAAERGFDSPQLFGAYLHALRWNCVTATNPRLFQAPYRAGIEVLAYQLEPLRKALLLPYTNLFIADDVGLGKTIEAGLIARELMMRQKVRRIIVACPPSVVLQWRDELESRFGLRFVVFDRDYVAERRRERGYGVNPWTTHTRFVISHALLRDESYAGPMRDWITSDDHLRPEQRDPVLFILDEAHNAAPASGSKYAIDSRFTRAVREIAPLCEHRLFLSATPHNGHSNSFSSLLEVLDPHRFCRGVKVVPRHLDAVMVRRLKADLREVGTGFPERRVIQIDIDGLPEDAPELVLARLLDEYREAREERVKDASKSARAAAGIVLTSLQKRMLSSIEAFASTLRVHGRTAARAAEKAAKGRGAANAGTGTIDAFLLEPPSGDDERAALPEEELKREEESVLEMATEASMAASLLGEREQKLLAEMTDIAEAARSRPDPRIQHLVAWLRENCVDAKGTWNGRRVLIFTEFADTKRYLDERLRSAFARTDQGDARIATFHGGMDEERREEIKRAFNADPSTHPLRILIATDAAREGVNLQNHCADLFHFDVPWNPSRMEQRNGRIDRKLQRAKEVRCHYFVFTQRPEDRVLEALVKKTRNIQAELGSLSPVLEARLAGALEGGIRRSDTARLVQVLQTEAAPTERAAVVDEELERTVRARQKLLSQQVSTLRDMIAEAKDALALDEDAFRGALSASLELLGAKPLAKLDGHDDVFTVAADDPRLMGDPTWAETLDTLRAPRGRDEKLWEWRKSSPIRPVVFHDTGTLDERYVHLHLEHRLVQRLLGRFLAQGFVNDDLSRACAVATKDPVPRVVLLGRLSLYGNGAARLHEEILAVTARYVDAEHRSSPLQPYAEGAQEKTLGLLEAALKDARMPPSNVAERLARHVARDASELESHLMQLGEARAQAAEALLVARGEHEANEMHDVLTTQTKRIQTMIDEAATPQLSFGFNEGEKRQLEADHRHWKKRLGEIGKDLATEPERIRTSYLCRARRIDPIGLVYLSPVSG
jgi:superfamily II DNA or RNA helicase